MNAANTVAALTETLTRTNTAELVHLCIVHAEGTVTGDAAWIALQLRAGFRGALALIEAEKTARALSPRLPWRPDPGDGCFSCPAPPASARMSDGA